MYMYIMNYIYKFIFHIERKESGSERGRHMLHLKTPLENYSH